MELVLLAWNTELIAREQYRKGGEALPSEWFWYYTFLLQPEQIIEVFALR